MKSFAVTVLLITTTTKVSCFVSIISQKALVTSSYCCSSYHRQRQQQHHPSMGNKKKKEKTDNNDSQVLSCHWWGQAEIDYSAANEYIDVHYGDDAPRRPYFETFGLKEESIYDARFGVTMPTEFDIGSETSSSINHQTIPPTLKNCGFTLVSNHRHSSNQQIKEEEQEQEKKKTKISDWNNLDEIQEYYLPELEELLQKLYDDEEEDKDDQLPSSSSRIEKEEHNHDDNKYSLKQQQQQQQQEQREGRNRNRRTIRHLIFWNPMLRARDLGQIRLPEEFKKTPTASFAASPHIDTDVNAYPRLEELLDLLEKNEVTTTASSNSTTRSNIKDKHQRSQRRNEILRDIRERNCGFAIVNAWRNIGSKPANPPLGLFSVRYNKNNNNNNNNKNNNRHSYQGFPEAAPDMDRSKWYIFSDIGQDEILFFCQYDRDGSWPSDLWHCALTKYSPSSSAAAPGGGGSCSSHPPFSRESFDIRCFIVFDQQVPEKQDRYNRGRGGGRIESKLTMKESGCFCENQFKVRDARNKT